MSSPKIYLQGRKMQFLTLTLLLVTTVCHCELANSVKELIKMANEARAPFTTAALERMNNTDLRGAKRAGRSADIVIINESGTSFQPFAHKCRFGSLSPGLLSEDNLSAHTSTVLGAQSRKDDEHSYVDCNLRYYERDTETYFEIELDGTKTIHSDIVVQVVSSPEIETTKEVSEGHNKQIVVRVSDSNGNGGTLARLSQRASAVVPQRKLKRSPNMFVKASKHGSSVRTI